PQAYSPAVRQFLFTGHINPAENVVPQAAAQLPAVHAVALLLALFVRRGDIGRVYHNVFHTLGFQCPVDPETAEPGLVNAAVSGPRKIPPEVIPELLRLR